MGKTTKRLLLVSLCAVVGLCAGGAGAAVIGHWRLDELANPSGNTTAADSSVNGLNGTYQPLGGPGPIVGVPGARAATDTAADFNGVADEVYLASPAALRMPNDFTITAWINPDRTTGVQRVFAQYRGGSIGYGFGLLGNDLRFTTWGVQDYNTNTIDLPVGQWSHIAVAFDTSNDATFFVNGVARQTIAGANPARTGGNNFFIGRDGTAEPFDGRIDDVQVHSGVLTAAQIQNIAGPVLIGHWKLDETANPSGNTQAADSSGRALHGTYQPLGGPGPVVDQPGARPNTGTAADFNGTNDEVYLASPGDLKMPNSFTIAAWVNPDDTSGVQRILSQYPAGSVGYGFGLNGNDLRFTTYGRKDYNTNTINLPAGAWSHVAVAFDENNDATFYVNGQPRQTITGTQPANIGNNNFFLGRTGGGEAFDGRIDDVQVYSGVLTQPEIQQITGPVLIGHWKLDETTNPSGNTQAADSSGNNLHGIYQPRGGPGPVVGVAGAQPATGTAGNFNGSNDEIYLASPGDLKMGNNFTIAAWINPDDTSGVQRVFSQYPAGGIGYGFGLVGDDLRFTTYGRKDYNTNTINLPTDHWSHVAVVFDENNDATFYVNGQPRQTITGTVPARIGNNNFFIGRTGGGEPFDGGIDDVRVYTGTLSQPQIQQITGPVLIGHWQLDETSNPSGNTQAADSSGNNLHGIYQPRGGPGPVVGQPGARPGTGTAADFNGSNDEVYLASPGDLKMGNNFTIAAWISPDDTTGVQRIFAQHRAGNVGYGFGLTGDDLRFTTWGIQDYNTNTIDIPTDQWTHVAVVFEPNNDATFFVNGQPRQTIAGAAPARIGNNNFFIGRTGGGEPFDGKIDDVRVYTGTLTKRDILAFTGPIQVARWKLDEAPNPAGPTIAVDSSGNGLNGAYQSGVLPGLGGPHAPASAAYFNGSAAAYVDLGTPGDLGTQTNLYTLMGWINPDTVSGRRRILGSMGGGQGFAFGTNGSDLIMTTLGVRDYLLTGVGIPQAEWTHVAVTLDENNTATFYKDGVQMGALTHGAPGRPTGNVFAIGRGGGATEIFAGLLADVQFYNGVLGGADIAAAAQRTPPPPSPTVFRYSFQDTDPPATLIVPDDSGSQHHALRVGAGSPVIVTGGPSLGDVGGAGNRSLDTSAGGVTTRNLGLLNNAAIAGAGGFTLETFLRRTTDTNAGGVEKIIDLGGSVHLSVVPGSDNLRFRPNQHGGEVLYSATGSLAASEWHHAAAVFDTLGNTVDAAGDLHGAMYLYLDRELVASDLDTVLTASYSEFYMLSRGIGIGQHPFGGERFQGLLAEPRVTLAPLGPEDFLAVPEPMTVLALSMGLAGLGAYVRRRRA